MRRDHWEALGALLLSTVVIGGGLALAEGASRSWIRRRGDAMDRVGALLRMDARLGWRQKGGFEGVFEGVSVRTDRLGLRVGSSSRSPGSAGSILLLGPSSSFGWGVAESETYARRLEAMLRQRHPGVSVINAGEIGFSTWQGLRLYEGPLRRLFPRVIIVAYGANDVDRYRFFFSDASPDSTAFARPRSGLGLAALNALRRLSSLRLLSRQAARWRGSLACAPAAPGLRVPPDEFAANLERFARYARDAGASVVFLTTPYRLAKAGDPDESEREYRLSADLAARGECGRSRDAFERARASEPARIARDLGEYNAIMRRAAARLRAPLVDAEGLLGQEGGMFVDLIHPSGEGHNRIARSLADTILSARLLGG